MVIEPNLPDPIRRMFLRLSESFQPLQPIQPTRLYAKPTTELPDPAKYPNSIMIDTTTGAIVVSDGINWS